MASKEHDDLCIRASKFLNKNGFAVAFDDRFKAITTSGEQPDALGFRNGVSCLIEVKVSRQDFLKDKDKRFRKDSSIGLGDWRFFLCPPDIILPEDLPDGWGLLYAHKRKIENVVGFPTNTAWIDDKPFNGNKQAECDYMYSALRRIKLNGGFDLIYKNKKEK